MRGDRLAELRKDAGLTQRQFAQQLHVSLNTVSGWERDLADPDDETKILLAQRFGVSVDYLMGLSDRPKVTPHQKAALFYVKDLPPAAERELEEFLQQLKRKYRL
ncbi:MAG TPA: helix-turn-helix domain-containing protein [Candidatus Fournierella pullicola]|uniref:Helix-turn-helix domain-containing protein n=1 Tax=Candidatus Allofournierella pullicola TaxID=2838596 RepID=A0A9D1V2E5_9FIRM|nr:helix-turn-helix domain-containing protein [Candidatus Fournierella pullicola]